LRGIAFLTVLLALAALLGVAADAQVQAVVEGEAYAAELVTVSLSGLAQGVEYRVEVVDGEGGLAAFTLIAYAGPVTIVEAGDGYVVFTADGASATLYLRAGGPGSYTLRILEAGQAVAEYPVAVEAYDSRGGAEPDVAVDTGYELIVAVAAALGMGEAAGATIYQAIPGGADGRATIYVVDDVRVTVSASFAGDFQALNSAGTWEVLVAGAYRGVFGAEAVVAVDGSTLSFALAPGAQASGVKFEYLEMYTENGGLVEFTSFYVQEGQAPTYLSFTKMTFNGDVKLYGFDVNAVRGDVEPLSDHTRIGFLQFKAASGSATVYVEGPAETAAGLSLLASSVALKLVNKNPASMAAVVLVDGVSEAASIEVRGNLAILAPPGSTLKAECIRFVAEPGYPDPMMPLQVLASTGIVAGAAGDPVVVEASCFRVEAETLATAPGDIMNAYGAFGMALVYLKAGEAVIGYGNVTVTDEGPQPESSRPYAVVMLQSTIEAPAVQVGGVYATNLDSVVIKAENATLRGAAISLINSEVYAGSILFHPLVFSTPVHVAVSGGSLEAKTVAVLCGTSNATVNIVGASITAETLAFRGYVSASFQGAELAVASILGGGSTPAGGGETVLDFSGARLVGDVEIAPLEYGVAVTGTAYLSDMGSVYLKGVRLDNATFKAEGVRAAIVAEAAAGSFRVEVADATLYFAGSSPEAYGYFQVRGASALVFGCTGLAGATIHVAEGEAEVRLLDSFRAGEYFEVKAEEKGNAKVYLRGGLSGEPATIEAPVFRATTGLVETLPEDIMDAAGEIVVEALYIKAGEVVLGYGNVTVTEEGPRPESSRPAAVKVYRAVIEAEGSAMIGGVYVTHVKASTVKAGKIVLRGASGEYLAATLQAEEIYVHPLVFNVDVKHVFTASSVEAATALRYICGAATGELHFYDSYIAASEAATAGRATVKISGSKVEVPVFRLGGSTPAGGDVNVLVITDSVVEAEAFKVYSLDYPAVVYTDASVEVKAGMLEFKAGNAPLTLGDEQVKARLAAYGGADGSLYLKAVNVSGRLEVYLEPVVEASTVYLEGGDGCFKLLTPAGSSHEVLVEKLAGPAFKAVAGDGGTLAIYFAEGEHSAALIQVKQGLGATVNVEAWNATLALGSFQAVTAATAATPEEIMGATGYLRIAGGVYKVEGDFTAGYGNVAVTEEGVKPESARPAAVHVEGATIEAKGTVMIGGVMETAVTGSTVKASAVVVRGAEAYLDASTVAADTVTFHPLVFMVPVEIVVSGSVVDAGEIRFLCGTSQAMVTVEGGELGSMERPAKIYLVGVFNMLASNVKAYLAEAVAGLPTPVGTGKYAHIVFLDSQIEGGDLAFKYGEMGAAFAVLGGTLKAATLSLAPAGEEGSGVLTIAGAQAEVGGCGDVAGSLYLVNVEGAVDCPAAETIELPATATVAAVLRPGEAYSAGEFLVKLAGGFTGPVAVYAAFTVTDNGEPYMLIVPVNLAYQSQVYEVYYPLPACDIPYILVDERTGAVLDAAKPEDPENCVFKSHLRVKPEAAGNAEPIIATVTAAVVEVQAVTTQTVTQTVVQTQVTTQTVTTTATVTATTTTTVTQTQTNMGAVAAAAIIGAAVGAAAAYALRARS